MQSDTVGLISIICGYGTAMFIAPSNISKLQIAQHGDSCIRNGSNCRHFREENK
jgi:hypothetical protein